MTLAALFVIAAVAGLLVTLLRVGMSFSREHSARLERESALEIAEAGLAEALVAMRRGGTGNVGSQAAPALFGHGLLWVETTDVGSDLKRVRSAAMFGGARVALERMVFHYSRDPITTALFGNDSVVIASNCLVDSFDSTVGTYASQVAGGFANDGAVVQSNGDVQVGSATEIHGDVHPGSDATTSLGSSVQISGTLEPLPEPRDLPIPALPVIPTSGAFTATGAGNVLTAGDYDFTSFLVAVNSEVTVEGPARIVVGDFETSAGSSLTVDASAGPVELYVTGAMSLASNSDVVTIGDSATAVTLNLVGGPDQSVDLGSNSTFYGTVYSPEGSVTISSNFEVFGAVVADELTLHSNVRVHFDEALRDTAAGETVYVAGSWSHAAFPDRALLLNRRDPAALLGVDPAALPTPEEAHEEAP